MKMARKLQYDTALIQELPNPKFWRSSFFSSPTPCFSKSLVCPFSESLVGPSLWVGSYAQGLCHGFSGSLDLVVLALCSCLSGLCAGSLSSLLDLPAWFWIPQACLIDGFNAMYVIGFCGVVDPL